MLIRRLRGSLGSVAIGVAIGEAGDTGNMGFIDAGLDQNSRLTLARSVDSVQLSRPEPA